MVISRPFVGSFKILHDRSRVEGFFFKFDEIFGKKTEDIGKRRTYAVHRLNKDNILFNGSRYMNISISDCREK
jgi:hypothetical protein